MESFCVNASVLGTERHLLCTQEGFSWKHFVPDETWHLSGHIKYADDWCLDSLLKVSKVEIDVSPEKQFVKAMQLVSSGSQIPWRFVMPSQRHKDFTKKIVEGVKEVMPKLRFEYFKGTWVHGNAVLRCLQRTCVDRARYDDLISQKVGNARAVESFEPDADGFADEIRYNRFGTLTGRLTVEKGPMILTVNRAYRDLLLPSRSGHIVSIDFSALEVRILLYESGKSCDDEDLYESIARQIGKDRKQVKGAVISELYGSSKRALGLALGMEGVELDRFVVEVKQYFNTSGVLAAKKSEFIKAGNITNKYGRLVEVDNPLDHIFVNYYSQSTGTDVTMLGFSKIAKLLQKIAPDVRPLFLLHDAFILDVPESSMEIVKRITSVRVRGYEQKFPLKVEVLNSMV